MLSTRLWRKKTWPPRSISRHRLRHRLVIILAHVSADRITPAGRRLHDGDIPNAGKRHLQGSRYRRRRETEHVHLQPELPEHLLLGHAKALLLVDDDQPQIVGRHIGESSRWVPIQHIDLALVESRGDLAALGLERNREIISTFTGYGAKRSLKVLKCCRARMVVGTSISTCYLPWEAALNAALSATSVLP